MANILKSSRYFPLQVTIDDREPVALEQEFRKLGNMIIHRRRLAVGDYLLDRDFLVERKSIPDFCLSIKDGRLFTQAGKLVNSRIPACIVLEGKNREFRKTDFSPKAIQGILLSISMAFRLPILRTKNTHESVEVMLQGFKQLTRDKLEEQRFYPRTFHSKPKKDPLLAQKLHILEGFPGIGVDKAERLLMKFGSLQAVFNAEIEDLLLVPGIGKRTVEGMLEILKK
ncbi:ERCC4 domain-containing protein [Algoriphagus boritolerans]|uniref:ERCC4-type nuclease n=1 Tax=Algoriphagus boritolerans DSM 17298 = JCM 18970 TaxID=1120964 RepID=A0A1H5S9T4_9BACT|nr:ERCC4 domain-containing protein [Algoriphagus boritolerans]SEF47322.1 ERCC4-type nuclease [Algoriphagus boritolerans DSM 17298 = JCM 18970]